MVVTVVTPHMRKVKRKTRICKNIQNMDILVWMRRHRPKLVNYTKTIVRYGYVVLELVFYTM